MRCRPVYPRRSHENEAVRAAVGSTGGSCGRSWAAPHRRGGRRGTPKQDRCARTPSQNQVWRRCSTGIGRGRDLVPAHVGAATSRPILVGALPITGLAGSRSWATWSSFFLPSTSDPT
jgi:hypothetical protein